jgi:MFS family permease
MFSSLRIRNFRVFMTGQSISVAGNWMQNVAVGWLVLNLTHSGGALGLIMACRYAPLLLLGSWGGLVADRCDKRRMLQITAAAQFVIAATLGVLTLTHRIAVWPLAALILAAGAVDIVDTPTRQTIINTLVGRERLANAIALNSILVNAARVVGPGAAGLLIATFGVGACFLINAATYIAVITGLFLLRASELIVSTPEVRAKRQIRAGLSYAWRTPHLRTPLILVAVSGAFTWEFQVTLPLFTSTTFHGDSRAYGWAFTSLAAGSILGGLLSARRRTVEISTVAVSAALWGVVILAAAAAPNLATAYPLLGLVGAGAVTFNSVTKTLLQTDSIEQMRGRIMALWSIGWQGTTVLGAPTVGYIGQWLGARYALGFGGLTTLAGALLLLARRGRVMDARSRRMARRSASGEPTTST